MVAASQVFGLQITLQACILSQGVQIGIGGGFEQIYNLYNPQLYEYADVLDTFIYRFGIGAGQFEIGTALGLFQNVINIILLLSSNKIVEFINKRFE